MSASVIADEFAHHTWANLRLIDACGALGPDQLATSVPGTYGSILDTIRHIVGGDSSYLFVLTGGRVAVIDDEGMDLDALRSEAVRNGEAWAWFVGSGFDPEAIAVRHRDDGSESRAPVGIRLAQALHHGTDHRSQVCTALTMLGIEPPEIDVWHFAEEQGRLALTPPTT